MNIILITTIVTLETVTIFPTTKSIIIIIMNFFFNPTELGRMNELQYSNI